jgi:hypothetical protein
VKKLPSLAALLFVTLSAACAKEDKPNPAPEPTTPLDPPAKGQGFQIAIPEFEVAPGDEIQNCYFYKVKDLLAAGGLDPTKPLNLHHIQIRQNDGSHHMNVFRVKTIVNLDPANGTVYGKNGQGECFKSPNWADWPLVANTQQAGHLDWEFPDGVANKIDPEEVLMVQTHFVNATTQKSPGPGKVEINFFHIDDSAVKYEMGTLFATKQSIRICQSDPTPKFQGTCQFGSTEPVHVIGANGHFHSRGKTFDMFAWDGQSTSVPPDSEKFYESKAWDEPPMLHSPELSKDIPAGGGVFYTCSYEWTPPDPSVGCTGLNQYDATKFMTPEADQDCCYTFGPIVEKNEHCNIFVYYYPKSDNVNCF